MSRERRRNARYQGSSKEHLDPTPIAPPVGYRKSPSLREQIREMVRSERLAQELAASGYETFEEADDFDVDDDEDPNSPYEVHFDPPTPAPEPPINERLKTTLDRIDSFLRGEPESDNMVNADNPRDADPSRGAPDVPAGDKKSGDKPPPLPPSKGRR